MTSTPQAGAPVKSASLFLIVLTLMIGCAVAAAAAFGIWRHLGTPIAMVDAPGGKLQCLSYTPFRGSQTPFDAALVIPSHQIDEDLNKLKAVTDCVRTYATDQGLDQVLPIAQKLGMKVLM